MPLNENGEMVRWAKTQKGKEYYNTVYTIGVVCRCNRGDDDIKEWADVVGRKKSEAIKSMIRHAIKEGHFFGYDD